MGVYQRDGNWFIDYYVNHRRKRQKIGPSRKLALDVLRKRKVEVAENKHLDIQRVEKIRFKDLATLYSTTYSKLKRSWKSGDRHTLKKHLVPFFGEKFLFEISPLMVEKFKNQKRDQGLSPASVNRLLACLKFMFNRAIEWRKFNGENPVKKVKFFKENNQRVRYLESDEIERLLSVCSPRLKSVVTVALQTGMRKGELQNLKWPDINMDKGYIVLRQTKNGETRYVPINEIVRQTLTTCPRHPKSPTVFYGKDGEPYNFHKSFHTAMNRSEIKDFRFHDLRHTFASHLVMAGADLNTVRELLGHKDMKMTLRYAHLSADHKTKAVALLAAKLDTIWTPNKIDMGMPKSVDVVSHLLSSTN